MTFLGKIFTVLIMIMSVLFMGLAMVVFATHKNWKLVVDNPQASPGSPLGLKQQLTSMRQLKQNLETEKSTLLQRLAAEQASRRYTIAALQTQLQQSESLLKDAEQARNALREQVNVQTATLQTKTEQLTNLQAEVAKLKNEVKTTREAADDHFAAVLVLTDKVNQLQILKARLEETRKTMAMRMSNMVAVLMHNGLKETDPVDNKVPDIKGEIVSVDAKRKMVVISVGQDDGLRRGHELDIYRKGSYIGRIRVRELKPNQAVGEVLPNFTNRSEIKEGDRVATKLVG